MGWDHIILMFLTIYYFSPQAQEKKKIHSCFLYWIQVMCGWWICVLFIFFTDTHTHIYLYRYYLQIYYYELTKTYFLILCWQHCTEDEFFFLVVNRIKFELKNKICFYVNERKFVLILFWRQKHLRKSFSNKLFSWKHLNCVTCSLRYIEEFNIL